MWNCRRLLAGLLGLMLLVTCAACGVAQTTPPPVPASPPLPTGPSATPVPPSAPAPVPAFTPSATLQAVEEQAVLDRLELAKAPQAIFEALPRFGASLFISIDAVNRSAATTKAAPGTPVASGGQPAANMPVPPNYLIGPGDTLALSVWSRNFEQVNQSLTVSPEGFVVLPQIGRVTASGKTLEQLRQELLQAYTKLFIEPTVTLVVSEQRTVDIYVTGDAARPGKYTLSGMATVLTALYAAQGPSPIGSFRSLKLNRAAGPVVDIDLYEYLLTGRRDKDLVLAPGDSLFVPTVQGEVGLAGELRRPGRYEMKEPLSVVKAIELAGGLKPSAYTPMAGLWRSNERGRWELTQISLADPNSADMQQTLRDGDLLLVKGILPTGENTVQLMGAVKRPGYYPCLPGTTVSSLLRSAEGLAWNAHMGLGVIRRMDYERHYRLITFNVSEQMYGKNPAVVPLEPKDEVEVFAQSDVEPVPEVRIDGAVAHPGAYQWAGDMHVSELILMAGSLLPEAFLQRADLLRLTPDQKYEVIPVNVAAALQGDKDKDLALERGDILKISKIGEAVAPEEVTIAGFVRNPGPFPRREGMKVSDLIFAAGGLRPGAGPTVQVTPGGFEGLPQVVTLQVTGQDQNFTIEPDMALKNGDSVSVIGRGEYRATADLVALQGRVKSPGSFTIKRIPDHGYTVWDLLNEGGGLLADANPNGIVVYRKRDSINQAQTEDLNRILSSVNRETGQAPMTIDTNAQSAAMNNQVSQGLSALITPGGPAVILPPRPVRPEDWVSAIPVSGTKLIASKGEQGNMQLESGDTVVVPRRVNTVTILGAVPRSGAVPFVSNQTALMYLNEAGGLREDAASDRMVVIHPNGAAAPVHMNDAIDAGDVIVVPTKHIVRTVRTETGTQQWLRAITSLITAALIF